MLLLRLKIGREASLLLPPPDTLPNCVFSKSFGLKSFYNLPEQACKLNSVNTRDYIFMPDISSGLRFELLISTASYLVWMLLIPGFILHSFTTGMKVKPGGYEF